MNEITEKENRRLLASHDELIRMSQTVLSIVNNNLWPRSLSNYLEIAYWSAYPPTDNNKTIEEKLITQVTLRR